MAVNLIARIVGVVNTPDIRTRQFCPQSGRIFLAISALYNYTVFNVHNSVSYTT